ncbi:hypothetical protein [Streptomyces abikoensis]
MAVRPQGGLSADHFCTVEVPVPEAGSGQVLVRNRLMSVAAVMDTLVRGNTDLPMPSYEPGEALGGPAIGMVIAAPGTGLKPGDLIAHNSGWREYAVLDETDAQRLDPGALPDVAAYLSQGLTAWLGDSGDIQPGRSPAGRTPPQRLGPALLPQAFPPPHALGMAPHRPRDLGMRASPLETSGSRSVLSVGADDTPPRSCAAGPGGCR